MIILQKTAFTLDEKQESSTLYIRKTADFPSNSDSAHFHVSPPNISFISQMLIFELEVELSCLEYNIGFSIHRMGI
jgi:hypothetical protein